MELLELGKTPITDDKPAGEDVKYSPEFDELQQEIDKMSIATSGGGGIDWENVVKTATFILAEKSKNILVAAYLSAGLIKTRQFEGFNDGLIILKELVDTFWEDLYPPKKRMRGRLNAVSWWMEQAEEFLKGFEPAPLDQNIVQEAKDNLSALDQTLSGKSEDAPILTRLLDYINRLPVKVVEAVSDATGPDESAPETGESTEDAGVREKAPDPPSVKPAAASPPPKPASVPATGAKPPVSDLASDKDAEKTLEFGLSHLVKAADYIMAHDLSNPLSYRSNRLAAWMLVDQLPMADKKQTMIPPPDAMIRNSIENLLVARDFEGAVLSCESRVREFLFWLDLSRLTVDALEQLGPRYQSAIDVVETETAVFVKKLPGLETLTFSDGTPFADKDTRSWLKRVASGPEQIALSNDAGSGLHTRVSELYAKAQQLVGEKKLFEAVQLFQEQMAGSSSGRVRLAWRIALSRILISVGKLELARPHLEEILKQIDAFNLEAWDPEMTIDGLGAVYSGLVDEEDENSKLQLKKVVDALSRISPAAAVKILGI